MTELKLYNTLTRMKEDFNPENPDNVRMYVCGPTVYDFAHIGNARPVIVFDVLYRLLRNIYGEDKVTYVRNITDVDDKINARALRDYPDLPLNEAIRNVTEKTANQFHADVKSLGCLEPNHEPRATEHIDGMVEMIQSLIDRNHAYIAKGAQGREVLFRVSSMKNYGELSNRIGKLDEQVEGARVAVESHKENAGDFVLWKESSATEPGWQGTFNGKTIHGRPGWHIECSVMAKHHLGETFDIHGGGLDLIFPHHENEIAQSCCAHGTDKMANIWMHNGYLQVEGKKMSKSDGNFVTIHDLLHTEKFGGRKWPGEVLRLAMLMTHYREPIDFSIKRLEEAENILRKLLNFMSTLGEDVVNGDSPPKNEFPEIYEDLNLPKLIRRLSSEISMAKGNFNLRKADKFINTRSNNLSSDETTLSQESKRESIQNVLSICNLLGIQFSKQEVALDESEIAQFINERLAYFAEKNFAEADRIRDELSSQGIQLKDSKDAETGERVTTWEVKR